jgi:hypothetical protein
LLQKFEAALEVHGGCNRCSSRSELLQTYRHRTDPGTTKTPPRRAPLLCEVVKLLPMREVVAEAPELLRPTVRSPKRCVVSWSWRPRNRG